MTIEEKLEYHLKLKKDYEAVKRKLERLALKRRENAPCQDCLYDGVHRCEVCAENFYEGFNIKDY